MPLTSRWGRMLIARKKKTANELGSKSGKVVQCAIADFVKGIAPRDPFQKMTVEQLFTWAAFLRDSAIRLGPALYDANARTVLFVVSSFSSSRWLSTMFRNIFAPESGTRYVRAS